ncbi:MAG: T9SS type A sorting domain-containing protein [Bacteroidetes bacterium]|nr:T9SS type A sorting domain-containing protein [Bacteroidota bacterium]
MKKILLTGCILFLTGVLSGQSPLLQSEYIIGGPPAGQIWESVPDIPGIKEEVMRELDYDSLNMRFTGNWPYGQSYSVTSSPTGDTVFVGSGGGVLIMDVSDPYNPVQISEVRARALVDASYYDPVTQRLYLAAYFSGVEVWDLSDIVNPVRMSRIPTNSYPRGGIFARGDYVYIVTVADGFYVADVSDPWNPVMISHQIVSGPLIWNSSFEGNYAYLALGTSGFRIIDFSDPYDPVIAGVASGNTTGIFVMDQIAYVVAYDFGLRIFDVSDPGGVTSLGTLAVEGWPYRVTAYGNYVYIANSTSNPGGGVNVVNVADPALPEFITTVEGYQNFISCGSTVVAATGNSSGCLILDVTDPENPVHAADIPHAWHITAVEASGDYAYTGSNGFRVFDLSDPTHPVETGFEPTQGALVAVSDTLAVYIPKSMTSSNPVNIMNVKDPYNPVKTGHYTAPVMTYDICLKDHYAFIACWWDGFRVVDFSNPSNPVLAAHEFGWTNGATPGVEWCYVQALDVYSNYLYLIDYKPFEDEDTKGLYIFDISNPEEPQFVSRYAGLFSAGYDLAAWGDYVYVADNVGGFEVINVADPASPYSMAYITLPDVAWQLDVTWPYVYVATYINGGVQVVDVSDPANPFITGYYQRSGCFALGVTAWENYAIIGDGPAGFQVYDFMLATGIAEPVAGQVTGSLHVFPNPAADFFTLKTNEPVSGNIHASIYNAQGQEVWHYSWFMKEPGQLVKSINASSLPDGVYLIRLNTGKEAFSGRVVLF